MSDHQCPSCGGFCPKSGCKRLDTNQSLSVMELISELKYWNGLLAEICITKLKEQRDEIINLKAYAMHERSLGAEKFAQECHDLRQEVDCLKTALRVALDALIAAHDGCDKTINAITTIKKALA